MTTDLLPRARQLADEIGALPSQRRLMAALRIGTDKARTIRDELAQERARRPIRRLPKPSRSPIHVRPPRRLPARFQPLPPIVEQAPVEQSAPTTEPQVAAVVESPQQHAPDPTVAEAQVRSTARRPLRAWPVLVLALPASIAIWAGWVGIGRLTGFGVVNLLPGIAPEGGWATIDTAITLPIGMEAYAAFALRVWLSGRVPDRARRFARWSAIGALALGAAGQVAYHLMVAGGVESAPWQITTVLSCIPVAVLGMGAALYHLIRDGQEVPSQ